MKTWSPTKIHDPRVNRTHTEIRIEDIENLALRVRVCFADPASSSNDQILVGFTKLFWFQTDRQTDRRNKYVLGFPCFKKLRSEHIKTWFWFCTVRVGNIIVRLSQRKGRKKIYFAVVVVSCGARRRSGYRVCVFVMCRVVDDWSWYDRW